MRQSCIVHYSFCFSLVVSAIFIAISAEAQTASSRSVKVTAIRSVYDGDTFRADVDGLDWPDAKGAPIRVAGIDTPEIKGACASEIERAIDARNETRALLGGARRIELTNLRYGYYGRIIADVWIDGVSLGTELIRRGHARVYGSGPRASWCR